MLKELTDILGKDNVIENEPLSKHTTLRIGGPAKYLVYVSGEDELLKLLNLLEEMNAKYYILGNGSNVLASDEGYDGVIIRLTGKFNDIDVSGNTLTAGTASMLSVLSKKALDCCLTGLEFASGIPGTLGGALVMNAGAYGGEMKQVVKSVRALEKVNSDKADKECYKLVTYSNDDMHFSYRNSVAKEKAVIFLSAVMELEPGKAEAIKESMDEMNKARREKQPLEFPSAGSTFKRPEGHFAGKLVSDAGLKGYCVGDARVSEKHAGFCINAGNASSKEFKKLMSDVSDKVFQLYNVRLEPEVIFLD